MPTKRPLPRHVLAKNLKALLDKTGLSPPEVAKQAGVDRKTLNNQLNGRFDPRPEQVDAVAAIFGFNHWNLLDPHFNADLQMTSQLQALITLYQTADEKGRESILRVAELAASIRK